MQETAKELRKKAYIEKCWSEISNLNIKISDYKGSMMARPRSLEGVENNNGWICIDSEDDLPKEKVKCHFIDKRHGLVTGLFVPKSEGGDVEFILNNATHYQPIPEPLTPLY